MSDLREPLTSSGGGDDASQTSQRSSASLLERIRAQRAAASPSTAPTTIQVPQYNPVAREEFSSAGPAGEQAGGGSFFTDAWTNISHSMETGMASLSQEVGGLESDEALLAPSAGGAYNEENYSMVDYFTTFVKDVYGTFLNLPLLVRVTVIFALLFTAFKLM